eukprot:6176987-Pleurochrysis_carterae.AAC.5
MYEEIVVRLLCRSSSLSSARFGIVKEQLHHFYNVHYANRSTTQEVPVALPTYLPTGSSAPHSWPPPPPVACAVLPCPVLRALPRRRAVVPCARPRGRCSVGTQPASEPASRGAFSHAHTTRSA